MVTANTNRPSGAHGQIVSIDTDTDVGMTIFTPTTTQAGDTSLASPARTLNARFTSKDQLRINAANAVAIIHIDSRFVLLDTVIQLYDALK